MNVRTQIVIHCRKIRIWEFVSDPDKALEWYTNIRSVEWETPKPAGRGTRIAFVARFLGRTLRYTYEITDWQPLERIAMETADGPFPMKTVYTFRSISEEATRVTLQNIGGPRGVSRIFSRLVAWMMKRANRKDLKQLKMLIEERYGCDPFGAEKELRAPRRISDRRTPGS